MDPTRSSAPCDFTFGDEQLQALWLEFQQNGAATCPETGAAIHAELLEAGAVTEPQLRLRCERCTREAEFQPSTLTGVQEVE